MPVIRRYLQYCSVHNKIGSPTLFEAKKNLMAFFMIETYQRGEISQQLRKIPSRRKPASGASQLKTFSLPAGEGQHLVRSMNFKNPNWRCHFLLTVKFDSPDLYRMYGEQNTKDCQETLSLIRNRRKNFSYRLSLWQTSLHPWVVTCLAVQLQLYNHLKRTLTNTPKIVG